MCDTVYMLHECNIYRNVVLLKNAVLLILMTTVNLLYIYIYIYIYIYVYIYIYILIVYVYIFSVYIAFNPMGYN